VTARIVVADWNAVSTKSTSKMGASIIPEHRTGAPEGRASANRHTGVAVNSCRVGSTGCEALVPAKEVLVPAKHAKDTASIAVDAHRLGGLALWSLSPSVRSADCDADRGALGVAAPGSAFAPAGRACAAPNANIKARGGSERRQINRFGEPMFPAKST
jgi:hypothetical protein